MSGAFAGLRVVDFTRGIAGPMAAMYLADQQADVVRIEPPAGDRLKDHPGYHLWNRNKERLVLDMQREGDRETVRSLAARADVAIFDAEPGALEAMGLDADTLRAHHPRLVHAWLPPYGTAKHWRGLPPDDGLLGALTGATLLQHSYDGGPVYLVLPILSYGHATMAAAAVAAALVDRERHSRGASVCVSGLHAFAAVHPGNAIRSPLAPRIAAGSGLGAAPCYRLYRCADGEWIFFGALVAPLFLRGLEVLGLTEMMAWPGVDGEFANAQQPPMRDAVAAALSARFAQEPLDHWLDALREADVPRAPVRRRETWFASGTVAANQMRVVLDHPALGPVAMPGLPLVFSETPGSVRHLLRETTLAGVLDRWGERATPPAPAIEPPPEEAGPLAGIRVLDFGQYMAGPLAGSLLAHLGADVVKIEPPGGEPFRSSGFGLAAANPDKRGLCLDLKQPAGIETLRDLAREADVVLDNFRPGVRTRLQLDAAQLHDLNPRAISCSITAYGGDHAQAAVAGLDPLVQANSGMMAAQGGPGEPVHHIIAINDISSGMTATIGILAALFARERSGRGQEVTTCLVNQSVMFQGGELTTYTGRPPNRVGARDCPGLSALVRYYACSGEWLLLSCTTPEHFGGLCRALDQPGWGERLSAEDALAAPRDGELAAAIAGALATRGRDATVALLRAHGVPAERALRHDEMFDDPRLQEEGIIYDWEDAVMANIRSAATYATWNGHRVGVRERAPRLGEHGREILRDYGFDDERVAALLANGTLLVEPNG